MPRSPPHVRSYPNPALDTGATRTDDTTTSFVLSRFLDGHKFIICCSHDLSRLMMPNSYLNRDVQKHWEAGVEWPTLEIECDLGAITCKPSVCHPAAFGIIQNRGIAPSPDLSFLTEAYCTTCSTGLESTPKTVHLISINQWLSLLFGSSSKDMLQINFIWQVVFHILKIYVRRIQGNTRICQSANPRFSTLENARFSCKVDAI